MRARAERLVAMRTVLPARPARALLAVDRSDDRLRVDPGRVGRGDEQRPAGGTRGDGAQRRRGLSLTQKRNVNAPAVPRGAVEDDVVGAGAGRSAPTAARIAGVGEVRVVVDRQRRVARLAVLVACGHDPRLDGTPGRAETTPKFATARPSWKRKTCSGPRAAREAEPGSVGVDEARLAPPPRPDGRRPACAAASSSPRERGAATSEPVRDRAARRGSGRRSP